MPAADLSSAALLDDGVALALRQRDVVRAAAAAGVLRRRPEAGQPAAEQQVDLRVDEVLPRDLRLARAIRHARSECRRRRVGDGRGRDEPDGATALPRQVEQRRRRGAAVSVVAQRAVRELDAAGPGRGGGRGIGDHVVGRVGPLVAEALEGLEGQRRAVHAAFRQAPGRDVREPHPVPDHHDHGLRVGRHRAGGRGEDRQQAREHDDHPGEEGGYMTDRLTGEAPRLSFSLQPSAPGRPGGRPPSRDGSGTPVSRFRLRLTTKAAEAPGGQGARTPAYSRRTPRTSNAALRDAAAADCQAKTDSGH